MVRTQLYLDEKLHARLKDISKKQGKTISELVREALLRVYGRASVEDLRASARGIYGLWKERDDIGDTEEYVRRLRDCTRRWGSLERHRRRR
jgi:hypothetical protein